MTTKPAKVPSSNSFSYHERRVLGSIVYANSGGNFTLDVIDAVHVKRLVDRDLVHTSRVTICGVSTVIYSATDLGKKSWYEWVSPPAPGA